METGDMLSCQKKIVMIMTIIKIDYYAIMDMFS